MAEAKRFAVVTGANKGIGFEVVRQLASHGINVVLTARDEKRGLDALNKLKESGLSGDVIFHKLDVTDSSSVVSLAEFVKAQFGRLDILVNNAGIRGADVDGDALRAAGGALRDAGGAAGGAEGAKINWNEIMTQTYDLAANCFQTNYYGAKNMIEAFIPLFRLSQSPRIVNVSSGMGKLKNILNEWAIGILSDINLLTEDRVEEVLNEFLNDFKEESLEAKGWPLFTGAYSLSKAAMNAYTRIVAKKHPNIKVNCVCPGFVNTDINFHTGKLTTEEGAKSVVRLALLPDDDPSGLFFIRAEESPF